VTRSGVRAATGRSDHCTRLRLYITKLKLSSVGGLWWPKLTRTGDEFLDILRHYLVMQRRQAADRFPVTTKLHLSAGAATL